MKIPEGLELDKYIELTSMMEAQQVKSAGHWREDVIERSKGEKIWGAKLPWPKTYDTFRLREGELTIVAGANGAKKSILVGQLCLKLAKHSKVCIASLEMKPSETLWRMCLQSAGAKDGEPTEDFINQFADFVDKNIVIYDQLDTVESARILAVVHYCAKELGVKFMVIDSLTKCGIKFDDRNGETDFINRLQHACKTLGIHVMLIAHLRKPQQAGDDYIGDKHDIRGASTISDLADNVLVIAANQKRHKLKELSKLVELDEKQQEYLEKSYDQYIVVAKQRHGSWEGRYNFYFHSNSLQVTEQEDRPVHFYFDDNVDRDKFMF